MDLHDSPGEAAFRAEARAFLREHAHEGSKSADLGLRLLGPEALPRNGPWQIQWLFAPSMHIAGGTDEIQKNIAAERVLGLPREPLDPRNVPFEDLPRS
jgi:alkylation response protein AidB-like acyl-CoA dehydrogenase